MHITFGHPFLIQIYAAEKLSYPYKDATTIMFTEILF